MSEMAGHADVSIALSVYDHVLPDMQSTAADSIDEALGKLQTHQKPFWAAWRMLIMSGSPPFLMPSLLTIHRRFIAVCTIEVDGDYFQDAVQQPQVGTEEVIR